MTTSEKKFTHSDESVVHHKPLPPRSRRVIRALAGTAATIVVVALIPTTIAIGYDRYFRGKIFPSISIFDFSVSGLTKDEAARLLRKKTNDLLENGLTFSLNGARYTISKTAVDAKQLVSFDIEGAVEAAYKLGRQNGVMSQTADRYRTLLAGKKVELSLEVDEQLLAELLTKQYKDEIKPAIDAAPLIKIDAEGIVRSIGIAPASSGSNPLFIDAVRQVREHLLRNDNPNFVIPVDLLEPTVRVAEAEPHLAEIQTLLSPRELRVVHENGTWILTRRDVAGALIFSKSEEGVQAAVDTKKLTKFFRPIRKAVEVPAKNAIFTMKGDEVVEFVPHKTGLGIDEKAFAAVTRDALYQSKAGVELPMKVTDPEITTEASNTLGIKERLGLGISSFKGSPKNRIKNIKNGAAKLDLVLIPPDAEFSLIEKLKPFDEKGGYLPELVIKGKKIEPEIGGGLCQIGTTTFRATMNSGLPISMRQNHSLVVSYYNDPENGNPGSDATIYDPWPDFKFTNDTGHYLLLTTEVTAKSGLRFTFWGTSDGRNGSYEAPKVSKWTPVPTDAKTLYLESDSVKTGEQKCKPGFPGAIASLKYTIEKPDATKEEKIYTSIYRMLPPVCLVAKGEIPKDDPAITTTSPVADVPIAASDAVPASQ